ncbi:MAG: tyrosine--tRNA ligase [bacterium]
MKINTDPKKIEEFLTRGVENIYPNKEFVQKQLLSGKKLKMYLGIDPTGPTLHLGHAVPLKKLKEFQDLGHEVILLIGDFTAMIGDPTDKSSARKQLTREQVLNNCELYKKQASAFLKFGIGGAKLKYNSKWLAKLSFVDLIELASHITYAQTIKRSMFQERLKNNQDIYLNEFLYPLMQGYDSVALDIDGEIGGNDQLFNMLVGRDLLKKLKNKDKFVITTKILEDNSGKKMGKTENNMVCLLDNEFEMFGKIMSWTDGMILPAFEICTNLSMEKIEKHKKDLESGVNPRDIKIILAKEIVKIYYNQEKADKAEKNFNKTFQKKGLPENLEEIKTENGKSLAELLVENKIVSSKNNFRRLVAENAISDAVSREKITDVNYKINSEIVLKVGKKRFVKIVVGSF